jgi:hypothetical protein
MSPIYNQADSELIVKHWSKRTEFLNSMKVEPVKNVDQQLKTLFGHFCMVIQHQLIQTSEYGIHACTSHEHVAENLISALAGYILDSYTSISNDVQCDS